MSQLEEIEKLVDLVAGSRIHELTAQVGERKITVTGGAVRRAPRPAPRVNPPPSEPSAESAAVESAVYRVIAPMVGIFHHVDPPVTAGMGVEEGQVLGVIESMKLMNDIRCDSAGVVTTVHIEDSRAVEYGQLLFEVEPVAE